MSKIEEIKLLFGLSVLIVIVFFFFIFLLILLFNKKQNEQILKNELEEKQHQNALLEKELELSRKLEEERERISWDLHDDIGSSLSAIKLKSEFIINQSTQPLVNETLREIIVNTIEMNQNMREIMWSLSKENDYLDSLIIYIKNYFLNYFDKTSINTKIQIPIIHNNPIVNSTIRRNLFLICKEAFHNVLKHSQALEVCLDITMEESTLVIKIIDNGIGITHGNKKGNGLNQMKKRLENINGTYDITSNSNGTLIVVSINI